MAIWTLYFYTGFSCSNFRLQGPEMSAVSLLRDPELVSFLLALNMLPSLSPPPPFLFYSHYKCNFGFLR